jgi:hypothetical protein
LVERGSATARDHPRPRLGRAIPLEGFDDKRIYVWFDAVIGYLSASMEWAGCKGDPNAGSSGGSWTKRQLRSLLLLRGRTTPFRHHLADHADGVAVSPFPAMCLRTSFWRSMGKSCRRRGRHLTAAVPPEALDLFDADAIPVLPDYQCPEP